MLLNRAAHLSEQLVQLADDVGRRGLRQKDVVWLKFVTIITVGRRIRSEQDECYLQKHFAAVDAHWIHGAKGHESDGDRRRRVHRVVVTEHTQMLHVKKHQLKSRTLLQRRGVEPCSYTFSAVSMLCSAELLCWINKNNLIQLDICIKYWLNYRMRFWVMSKNMLCEVTVTFKHQIFISSSLSPQVSRSQLWNGRKT